MKLIPKIVILVTLIVLTTMIVVGGLTYVRSKEIILTQIEHTQKSEVEFVAQRFAEQSKAIERTAEIVAKNRSIRRALDTGVSRGINQRLNEIIQIYPDFLYAFVIDNNNEILAVSTRDRSGKSTRSEERLGDVITLPPVLEKNKRHTHARTPQNDPYETNPQRTSHLTQWIFAPVKSGPVTIGWVVLSYDWEMQVSHFLKETKTSLNSNDAPIVDISIFDTENQILASSSTARGTLTMSPDWLVANKGIQLGSQFVTLAVINDRKLALNTIDKEGQFIFILTLFGVIILVSILAFTLKKTLVERITTLANGHDMLSTGKLQTRLPDLGNDELGNLSNSFNNLAQWLSEATVSKEYVNDIINSTADGLITIDAQSKIDVFNPAAEKIFGYQQHEVKGKDVAILMQKDERENHLHYVSNSTIYAPRIINGSRDLYGLRKDGSIFPMELTVSKLSTNEAPLFVGIFRDISERKEDEAELKQNRDQLQTTVNSLDTAYTKLEFQSIQLQGLADEQGELRLKAEKGEQAKSEFLATMSHEIRTPLSGILGMAEALLEENLSSEHQRKVEIIYDSGHALMRLLNDILDFSKLEAGMLDIEEIDFVLEDEINLVFEILMTRVEKKHLFLNKDISSQLPKAINNDPTRFRQVLYNLIGNAIKFTEKGGITVKVSPGKRPNEIYTEVQDTGVGIKETAQKSLFKRFQQEDSSTARKFGGSGLGLAICKSLATLMDGEIGLESEFGKGSTFWFSLTYKPVSSDFIPKTVRKRINRFQSTRGLNILIADDSSVIQKVLHEMLRALNHETKFAENGAAAVEMNAGNQFDLIIMDRRMPFMDGMQATQSIRQSGSKTPIIGCTADAMRVHQQEFLNAGVDICIAKPINKSELLFSINEVLCEEIHIEITQEASSALAKEAQGAELIDFDELSILKENVGGDILQVLLEDFMATTPSQLSKLKECIAAQDIKSIKDIAHTIKGSAATFGFIEIVNHSRSIELGSYKDVGRNEASLVFENLSQSFEKTKNKIEDTYS